MSARVRVEWSATGTLVARKRAVDPCDDTRLDCEAQVLRRARHPGVVELVGLETVDGRAELVTAWVGARSLADRVPLPPVEAAALLAATAEIVADLHTHDVVHGSLDATHVLLDHEGHPVLCGFGTGGRPSDDVAGLGTLLREVIGAGDETDPIPVRRFGRRARTTTFTRRALLNLADQATADDPSCRPSARTFAAAVLAAAPDAALPHSDPDNGRGAARSARPDGPGGSDDHDAALRHGPSTEAEPADPFAALRASPDGADRAERRRRAPLLVGAAVVVFVAVALFDRNGGRADSNAVTTPPTTAPPATTTPATVRSPSTVVSTREGAPIVERDGARYTVGEPGDQAVVGDWACTGEPTVAVLRPTSGEVFVFSGWAEPGRDLLARPVLQVTPGSHLEPTDRDPDGCAVLLATQTDGTAVPVPLPEDTP